MKRLLIAGCGDLGVRLAVRLNGSDWQITGLRRRAERLPDILHPVAADLLKPDTLTAVAGAWDAVVYQATPAERSRLAYRAAYVDGLRNLLDQVDCGRLIFVSSTSVYGQDNGEWVDESSIAEPDAFNGQTLREAERLAAAASAHSLCVRFSGIYGPGRDYLLRQLRSEQAQCRPAPVQWTNRIHADDCAGVLAHLLHLSEPESLYCASDSLPVDRCEVLHWLASQLGTPPPRLVSDDNNGQGKRVSNRRLLASGYHFIHPDFRSGYAAMLT